MKLLQELNNTVLKSLSFKYNLLNANIPNSSISITPILRRDFDSVIELNSELLKVYASFKEDLKGLPITLLRIEDYELKYLHSEDFIKDSNLSNLLANSMGFKTLYTSRILDDSDYLSTEDFLFENFGIDFSDPLYGSDDQISFSQTMIFHPLIDELLTFNKDSFTSLSAFLHESISDLATFFSFSLNYLCRPLNISIKLVDDLISSGVIDNPINDFKYAILIEYFDVYCSPSDYYDIESYDYISSYITCTHSFLSLYSYFKQKSEHY